MTSPTSSDPTSDEVAPSSRPGLALASSNRGKIAEFQSILGNAIHIRSLIDLGLTSPEEDGTTFEANAVLKARHVFERTGMVTLADDSGLEVDALGGAPGVVSARYAGEQHDDDANRDLLLRNLDAMRGQPRTARFVAVITIIDANGHVSLFRGTCEGTIAFDERGTGGFGYDSLFELPDGRTMAEHSNEEKNALSHRAHAMRRAMPALRVALGLPAPDESSVTP
ncbi:MAG: RdgB/HAM1 family non-canonical purine NTP pyrophosphatase [Thermomicrobiales bacterium]